MVNLDKEALKRDGLTMVCHQVNQNVLQTAQAWHGPQATAIEGYIDILSAVIGYSSITIDQARDALKDVTGPHLDEVLEALRIIELQNQE